MKNKLRTIVTRTGDDGTTGLANGERISKDNLLVQVLGDLDELNSYIGLLVTEITLDRLLNPLCAIQHELFEFGAELSSSKALITSDQVRRLEWQINEFLSDIQELKEFILPGGSRDAALAHVCRAICRRSERALVSFGKEQTVSRVAYQYINRLSDWFFVFARVLNKRSETPEIYWKKTGTKQ